MDKNVSSEILHENNLSQNNNKKVILNQPSSNLENGNKEKVELSKNVKQDNIISKVYNFNDKNKICKEYEKSFIYKNKCKKEEKISPENENSLQFIIHMIFILLIIIFIEQSIMFGYLLKK